MELSKQVCSLELAKKLKELGVKQESLFYYQRGVLVNAIRRKESNYYLKCQGCQSYLPENRHNALLETDCKCSHWKFKEHFWEWDGYLDKGMNDIYSAFTVAELGEILSQSDLIFDFYYNGYTKLWESVHKKRKAHESYLRPVYGTEADTEADARAKMLIYLIENKLVEVN